MTTPNDTTPPKKTSSHHHQRHHHPHHRRSTSTSSSSSPSPPPLPPPQQFPQFQFLSRFQNYTSKTSVLSPRRSSRLLEKHLGGSGFGFGSCAAGGATPTREEASSDYGTLSVQTTTDHNLLTQSLLSDEISILSLDDLCPSQQQHQQPTTKVTLSITPSKVYILLPQKTNYNFRYPSSTLSVTILPPLPPYLVENRLQIFSEILRVRIESTNYDFSLNPLVSIPFGNGAGAETIYLYFKEGSGDEETVLPHGLKLTAKLESNSGYVTFYIRKPGEYYLIPRNDPRTVRSQLNPSSKLVLETDTDDEEEPRIRVEFPPNSTDYELMTELQVHRDNYIDCDFGLENCTPAAPVFCLSPNSVSFKVPVVVTVEVVDYHRIKELFPGVQLKVYQCREQSRTELCYKVTTINGTTFVTFSVTGFSFFRVIWTTITQTLSSTKLGISRLFTKSHCTWMKCQATMDEYENDRFSLEVCVYNAGKSFPEVRAYSHVVGKTERKFLKHGLLVVGLKSSLFEANEETGEEAGLEKSEEFWGQDLNMQFSLRFKGSIERGTFGKVLLKHRGHTILEFNIQKHGNEAESKVGEDVEDGNRSWSTLALQELATYLFITDGDNWKTFAKHLGFTKHEIKTKFKSQSDPFRAITDCYQTRGGTQEEFIKCLYEVHRQIKFTGATGSPRDFEVTSRKSKRSNKSSGLGSSMSLERVGKKALKTPTGSSSSSSDSDEDSPVRNLRESVASGSSQQTVDSVLISKKSSKKRTKSSAKTSGRRKKKKRRKYSENVTTSSSSSEEEEEEEERAMSRRTKNSDSLRSSTFPLENTKFWDFCTHLTSSGWKSLGRTLLLDESILVNIEQTHKCSGNRECYYQVLLAWKENYPKKCTFGTLYQALVKEGMVGVAKKMTGYFNSE